jgi:hypothetical protein
MTEGHRHRIVSVPSWDVWYARALRWPLLHSTNQRRVERSSYPYGPCTKREGSCLGHRECWTLSTLGILHRWTGLTLLVIDRK